MDIKYDPVNMWVDDIRKPPPAPESWHWFKTSEEAIDYLEEERWLGLRPPPQMMSLDHDLGGDDTTRRIVLWCCETGFWPGTVVVHSANPVGREWLEGMIARYKP